MNRREFIAGVSATALAALSSRVSFAQNSESRLNIVVFWQEGFPAVDGSALTRAALESALKPHGIRFAGTGEIGSALESKTDVFINPYGSAFPQSAWKPILKYLIAGGNFVNLGGCPFSVPVGDDLKPRTALTNYHKRLGITQYFESDGTSLERFINKADGVSVTKPKRVFESYLKLSNVNDFPDEAGSDGRREASVTPLAFGFKPGSTNEFPSTTPIVQIDRLRGDFAGGRWIFANFEGAIDAGTIATLTRIAAIGGHQIVARTRYAHVRTDENPVVDLDLVAPKGDISIVSADVKVTDAFGRPVQSPALAIAPGTKRSQTLKPLMPGYYEGAVNVEIKASNGTSAKESAGFGFWVTDEKPIGNGTPITADRHFLYRDGEPFPVTGTTFMSPSVARRFLLEPTVSEWNAEFSRMKNAGVNMIRTGIWTGWSLYFDEKGDVREDVLRAWEAFVLTAAKYDIPVIFTFYAFMPEMYGGENAYLDPKSIAGQKRFLSAFASRVKGARAIIWDLINEPSFANPKMLWSCRPNYDKFESAAWREWLIKRYAEPDPSKLAAVLRDRWQLREDEDAFALPALKDFDNINIHVDRRPMRVVDFRLFAQDVFTQWASTMRETLRAAGNKEQLVMVGQDEAGTNDSPSTQFHGDAMDLTGLHNWWANDDLLWDSVVTKNPNRANLVQETGLMFYEKQDGSAWRSDTQAADLLERKLALSLGASGAGFIQWIWNINPFMDNENEAAIGFCRVDGSFKEEFERFRAFAKFANQNRRLFKGKIDEDIVLVIPHSQMFSARNLAVEATKRAVRALHYDLKHSCRAVSEYRLETLLAEERAPLFLIMPAPRSISDAGWANLLKLVEKGSTLIITGYFEADEHFRPAERVGKMFGFSGSRPVNRRESGAVFSGEKLQRIERADADDEVREYIHGKGKIVWHPVPLENGDSTEPIAEFYKSILPELLNEYLPTGDVLDDILIRVTRFETVLLFTIINESGTDREVMVRGSSHISVVVSAGRANLVFVDKRTGNVLSRVY